MFDTNVHDRVVFLLRSARLDSYLQGDCRAGRRRMYGHHNPANSAAELDAEWRRGPVSAGSSERDVEILS